MSRTRVTPKYQTTIPREIRGPLGIKAGDEVEWRLVREFAVVKSGPRIKNPVKFLISQARLDVDAVKLVRQARAEMF